MDHPNWAAGSVVPSASDAEHWPAWRRLVARLLKDLIPGREREHAEAGPTCITSQLLATI
jgi:hypothetical protein